MSIVPARNKKIRVCVCVSVCEIVEALECETQANCSVIVQCAACASFKFAHLAPYGCWVC